MIIKKNLISFLIFISILFSISHSLPATLNIIGNNRLQYWQWREGERNFFEDALNINAIYKNFRGNIEWYTYEPSNVKYALRKEGIRKKFLEYKNPEWSIKAGNFYQFFGRGLVLNQTLETSGNIDRDIYGLYIDYKLKFITISLFSGKPKNLLFSNGIYSVVNDTSDILQGGEIDCNLISFLPLSTNIVRLLSENPGVETPRKTFLYGLNISFIKGPLTLYTELAKKQGWDELLFSNSKGNGLYSSMNVFLSTISVSFEYLYYDSLGYGGSIYRYNGSPTGNLDGYSINRASDETGWMFDVSSNPFGNWYIRINKSVLTTISSDSIGFDELYGELKGDVWKNESTILLSVKNLEYKSPEPIIDKKTEWIPHIGLSYRLGSHSFNIGLNSRIVSIDTTNFMDNGASVDIGIFPYLTISGRGEIRNREVLLESEGTVWKVIEMRWDVSENHTINIIAGSEKGGLVCSGGVCRIEEPFNGIKINLLSRF